MTETVGWFIFMAIAFIVVGKILKPTVFIPPKPLPVPPPFRHYKIRSALRLCARHSVELKPKMALIDETGCHACKKEKQK